MVAKVRASFWRGLTSRVRGFLAEGCERVLAERIGSISVRQNVGNVGSIKI
jgi:hypothetical protein